MKRALALLVVFAACDDRAVEAPPAQTAAPGVVSRTDIVADSGGAGVTDPRLVNAWGLSFNPAGFAWVSATESGISGVYRADGSTALPAVEIPAIGDESSPTGQVHNPNTSSFLGDELIFVTEQ